jgi:hypothetical protein
MKTPERILGLFPAANIVIANTIGGGIFTTSERSGRFHVGDPAAALL